MKILPVNFYRASAPKKNASFCGHKQSPLKEMPDGSKHIVIVDKDMGEFDFCLRNMRPEGYNTEAKTTYVDKYIDIYKSSGNPKWNIEKTGAEGVWFYVADIGEKIPDEMYKECGYIAKEIETSLPTLEQLEHKYTSLQADPHDYLGDVRQIISYQYRKLLATTDSEDVTAENLKKAAKLSHVLEKSEKDFAKRDMLAEQIEEYKRINAKLKSIEVEKYLLDERTEQIKKELAQVKEREASERRTYGPSYNSTYPPSQTYYHRLTLENQLRDNPLESEKLQKEYDKYLALKNKQSIEGLYYQFYIVSDRLAHKFEEVKELYKNF